MKNSKQLLLANRAWAAELTDEKADFFSLTTSSRRPRMLWIGCLGSRTSPEQKTQSLPGSMLVHHNIANLVKADDLNLQAVLQYAIETLQIPDIVVCGHHGCGGIKSALAKDTTGPVDAWLEEARIVAHNHADELANLPDAQRVDRLVEMNVRDQLLNLARTETVEKAFAAGRDLTLHGWVYDVRDGILKPLMVIDGGTVLDEVGRPEPVLV